MILVPKGMSIEAKSNPLTIDEAKNTEMLDNARELLTKQMEAKELMDLLEAHYVSLNEHYTSKQLKCIVVQLYNELNPEPEVEEPEEEIII